MSEEYKQLVKESILDEGAFARAVFSGRRRGHALPWRRVTLRPVTIKGARHIQFSYLDEKRDITKNYAEDQVGAKIDELLGLPFSNIHLQSTGRHLQILISRRGKASIRRHDEVKKTEPSFPEHDRRKRLLLAVGEPDPFLIAMGIMTEDGRVKARMRRKFRQINEFLRLVIEAGIAELSAVPLRIVDCGCGNAYLTFAVYHYLNDILGVPAHLVGIDVNKALVAKRDAQVRDLGWEHLHFEATRILDYQPEPPPDVVIALHACDTATDEALCRAVRWGCRMLFVAPCCHHHLQAQLDAGSAPAEVRALYRYGILRERLGDILTDTLRALILRIMGYRTDAIEFVSTEHTDKNVMIRAVKVSEPGNLDAAQEYLSLTEFFGVTPFLARLLEDELMETLQL